MQCIMQCTSSAGVTFALKTWIVYSKLREDGLLGKVQHRLRYTSWPAASDRLTSHRRSALVQEEMT